MNPVKKNNLNNNNSSTTLNIYNTNIKTILLYNYSLYLNFGIIYYIKIKYMYMDYCQN